MTCRPVLRIHIRIRMNPYDLVSWIRIRNPHSKCGFQMRIRDKLHKNSADENKN
jgi:hypothetical protein